MLHLKVFLLPRKGWEGGGGVSLVRVFSLSLSLFPLPLVRVKMMSWTERKYCNGIEDKARVRSGNNKAAVYNMSMNCFKNKKFQEG